mgnify:CR=1 FL=1
MNNSFMNNLEPFFDNFIYKHSGVTLTCKLDKSSLKSDGNEIHLLVDFFADVDDPSNSDYDILHREYKGFPIAEIPAYDEQHDGFIGQYKLHKTVYKLIPSSGYTMLDGKLQYSNPFRQVFCIDSTYMTKSKVKKIKSGEQKINFSDTNKVPLIVFLRALTGKSYKELNTFYNGMLNFSIPYEYINADVETCAYKVMNVLNGNDSKKRSYIRNNAYSALHNYFCVNFTGLATSEKIRKFQDMQSFHRLEGMLVHKIPSYTGIEVGTIITRQIATQLDNLDVTNPVFECQVKIPSTGKIVTYKRCKCSLESDSVVTEQFNTEEFMYAVYDYLITKCGIPYSDDMNSLDCCVLQDASGIIKSNLHKILFNITRNFANHLDKDANRDNILDECIFKDAFVPTGDVKTPLNKMLEYIKASDESRDTDVTNSLATFQQGYKISKVELPAYQQIHESHVGRIDPYATPESKDAGLNSVMCLRASIDQYNYITRPVYKVTNGVPDTSNLINLSTLDEKYKVIAPYGIDLADYIEGNKIVPKCTLNFKEVDMPVSDVEYQLAYLNCSGPALTGCFFAAHNNTKRLIMANNAITQAAPVVVAEKPYIHTDLDSEKVGIFTAEDIIKSSCISKGIPYDSSVDYKLCNIKIKTTDSKLIITGELETPMTLSDGNQWSDVKAIYDRTFKSSNSTFNRLNVHPYNLGVYGKNDIVLNMSDIVVDDNGEHSFSVGNNVKVLFICNEGFGFEDSAQINKRYRDNYGLCTLNSTKIEDYDENNIYYYTNKYHSNNKVTEDYLGDDGLPKVGTRLYPGSVIVGRVRRDIKEAKTVPAPIRLKSKEEGIVLYAKKETRDKRTRVEILLWNLLTVDAGDKLTGFHGNKSVCSRAIDFDDMFYTSDGQVPDLILNPLGVPGRENIGQIVESLQAEISRKTGKKIAYRPCKPLDIDEIVNEAESYDIKPVKVYDPKTGEALNNKCFMGTMYFTRSTHIMSSKYNSCSIKNSLSVTTHQTKHETGGGGGQRISEMTAWSYKALGCDIVYDTLTSLHSDDLEHLESLKRCLEENEIYDGDYSNYNALRINAYFRFLGINLYSKDGRTIFEPINTKRAENLITTNFTATNLRDHDAIIADKYNQLDSRGSRFTKLARSQDGMQTDYAKIPARFDYIHPLYMTQAAFCNLFLYIKAYKFDKNKIVPDEEVRPLSPLKMATLFAKPNSKRTGAGYIGVIGSSSSDSNPIYRNGVNVRGLLIVIDSKIANATEDGTKYINTIQDEYSCVLYDNIEDIFHCFYNPNAVANGEDPLDGKTFYNLTTAEEFLRGIAYPSDDGVEADIDLDYTDDNPDNDSIVKYDLTGSDNTSDTNDDDEDESLSSGGDSISDKLQKPLSLYATFKMFKKTYGTKGKLGVGEYMTKYVIIPPPPVRPIKDLQSAGSSGAQSAYLTTIGRQTNTVVNSIKSGDSPAIIYEHITNTIGKTFSGELTKQKLENASVFVEMFKHSNKKSVVRDTIIAKRIDFSGRSVICVDPTLRIGEAGVPLRLALNIHSDRIMHEIEIADKNKCLIKMVVESNSNNPTKKERMDSYSDFCQKLATGAYNLIKIKIMPSNYKSKFALCEDMKKELVKITNRVLEKLPAVLSRDPALHQFSIAGFNTKVRDGFAISIHPLSCKGFNADFDGDQMSINYPQHKDAINELNEKGMFGTNLINPQSGESIIEYSQDSVAGFYYATLNEPDMCNIRDVIKIHHKSSYTGELEFRHRDLIDVYDKLESKLISVDDTIVLIYNDCKYLTTVGRAMFNSLIGFDDTLCAKPSDAFKYTPDSDNVTTGYYAVKYNTPIKKGIIRDIITSYIIEHKSDCDKERYTLKYKTIYEGKHGEMLKVFDRLKDFGYYMSKESGITLSMWDLTSVTADSVDSTIDNANISSIRVGTYKSLGFLTDNSSKRIRKGIWGNCNTELTGQFENSLKNSKSLELMINSGARGSISNLVHMCGMVGSVLNTNQEEMEQPIRSSYAKGLCISEQLVNSYNGRRVLLNTQLGTPITGEQTRQLIYMAEHLHIVKDRKSYEHSCNVRPTTLELEYSLDIQALKDELSTDSLVAFVPATYKEYKEYCESKGIVCELNGNEMRGWDKSVELMNKYGTSDYQDKFIVRYYINNNVNKAVLKSAGVYYIVDFKYKLADLYHNILKMRSLELNTIANASLVSELKKYCIQEVEYEEVGSNKAQLPMIDKEYYIITDKAIKLIEKYHAPKLGIYTLLGCKHKGGICPRCNGYDYKNLQKPIPGLNIGHIAAQAIGECTTQLTLDIHKEDSSGKGNKNSKLSDGNMDIAWRKPHLLNIAARSYVNRLAEEYEENLLDDICMELISESDASNYIHFEDGKRPVTFARTDGIVSVKKYKTFYIIKLGDDCCIADSSCIGVHDGEYVYKGKSFITYPLVGEMFKNAPVRFVNNEEVNLPKVIKGESSPSYATNHSYVEYPNSAWLEAAKDVWLTIVNEVITKFNVLGRNIETIVKTIIEIGIALESKESDNVFRGYYYPVDKLRSAEVLYMVYPVTYAKNMLYHNKIVANMAKEDPKGSLVQAMIYGLEDSGSTITDICTSAVHRVENGEVVLDRCDVGEAIAKSNHNVDDILGDLMDELLLNNNVKTVEEEVDDNATEPEEATQSNSSDFDYDYGLDSDDETGMFV